MNSLGVRLALILAVLAALLLAGTFAFKVTEDLSLFEAFYFTIVTVSTVGYGDIQLTTTAGRIVAIVLIIVGVGTFLAVVASVTQLLLQRRQERLRRERLNMAVSAFFSEIGTYLLRVFCSFDPGLESVRELHQIDEKWTDRDFNQLRATLRGHTFDVDPARLDLALLRGFLTEKSQMLLGLLENPNLVEHEAFTDLLRAIFHLKDELVARPEPLEVPESDLNHLAVDVRRAYALLAGQWVDYLMYLRREYPFLFSLALRLNPFCRDASPVVG